MSIQSEIDRIKDNVADTYAAVAQKGGELPAEQVSDNLAAAVLGIPSGGGTGGGVPKGTIVIWSGTTEDIPSGWALCDGKDGRPDLRDRFVLGAGTNHNVGETGGSETVSLIQSQMPKHRHGFNYYTSAGTTVDSNVSAFAVSKSNSVSNVIGDGYAWGSVLGSSRATVISYTGEGMAHPNMPPYYALCYIIKVAADETDGLTMEQVNGAINDAITGAIEEAY